MKPKGDKPVGIVANFLKTTVTTLQKRPVYLAVKTQAEEKKFICKTNTDY